MPARSSLHQPPRRVPLRQGQDIPVPQRGPDVEVPLVTAGGGRPLVVRPGAITVWWNGDRAGYGFAWPVLFVPGWANDAPAVLGLGGVVKTCRWTFDGGYAPGAPRGHLTLEDTR